MTPVESIISVFRNYANFHGRAQRSEFWWFALISGLVYAVLWILVLVSWGSFIVILCLTLALFLPFLAVGCRRLHDTGKSGRVQLLYLVPYVGWIPVYIMCAMPGTPGPNRYGSDPLQGHPGSVPSAYLAMQPAPVAREQSGGNRFCSICGTQLQPGSRFCTGCGTAVTPRSIE